MNLAQLDTLLSDISRERGVNSFVVMGSLSVLGLSQDRPPPERMLLSNEVDAYPELDPGLALELAKQWGQGSEFERLHGYYFDPIRPQLPTLPAGWQERMIPLKLPSGVAVRFLDPNDAAVSKYARGEPKDSEWIREGLRQSLLSLATIEYRFRETPFLDRQEHDRAKAMLEEDRQWLSAVNKVEPE
ncbi:MAG: DUF6036 family nucleotidyltransferase [Betaproteobacteria bacterium]